MSQLNNNQRWLRINNYEVFTRLITVPNVVIVAVEFPFTHSKPLDTESFGHFNKFERAIVSLLDPLSVRTYKNPELYSSSQELINYTTTYTCFGTLDGEKSTTHIYKSLWHFEKLKDDRFNPIKPSGFYLLEQAVVTEKFLPIETIYDLPDDMTVYHPQGFHDLECKLFEYPLGNFTAVDEDGDIAFSRLNFEEVCSNLVRKVTTVNHYAPLCFSIRTVEGMRLAIEHMRDTFVSSSGKTKDEYFDEMNDGV